jgi:EamA domain-containing membrane protein RarD
MLTLSTVLVVLAFLSAGAGVFNAHWGGKSPNWVALSLALYFAAMLVRA